MAPAYNDRPPGRQSSPPAADGDATREARSGADRFLLASVAAADRTARVRAEEVLSKRGAELARAARLDVVAAAQDCLAALAADCDCDSAAVAVLDLKSRWIRVAAQHGNPELLAAAAHAPLLDAVLAALATGRALEHPAANPREALPAAVATALSERGVRSMRWTLRRLDDSLVAISALHAIQRCRYWTPASRRLHDGTTELLLATPALLRRLADAWVSGTPAADE